MDFNSIIIFNSIAEFYVTIYGFFVQGSLSF